MTKTVEQASELLKIWGATDAQRNIILPDDISHTELEARVNTLLSIQESLDLLYPNSDTRHSFMASKHKHMFDNNKPLAVISSGSLDALREVQQQIRSLVCI
ncbi:hypothetical protein BIZ37_10580 [Photobacterium sp. BZF1]|uniref:hypothetical protein n=1 Tax=Photobacterium sp. BZF1 TaxID=1904457 RepID=UPI0016537EB3|nr:hypothetical protein [Photobacterium sp. BZF1]MBC7003004.1 hypothetical protein [Photobacterium sp. BZF1]